MGIEGFNDIESTEGGGKLEVSELVSDGQERARSQQFRRLKKDEEKAIMFDKMLCEFFNEMIKTKDYDDVLEGVIDNISGGMPSSFILGVLSLIYHPISDKIRNLKGKENIKFGYKIGEIDIFDDENLPNSIKDRINFFVEDIFDITTHEYSEILMPRLIFMLRKSETIDFFQKVFTNFFEKLEIQISKSKAQGYTKFIISEIEKELKKVKIQEI